jgi:hypothetical protein
MGSADLEQFHNRHAGQSVLVCGCGESLSLVDDAAGVVTIGVNDVGRHLTPTYLVIDDAAIGSGNSLRYAGILGVGSRLRLPAYVATQINSTTSRIPGEATWSST